MVRRRGLEPLRVLLHQILDLYPNGKKTSAPTNLPPEYFGWRPLPEAGFHWRVNSTAFGRNPHHGAITDTDVEKFPESLKHALLKVRKVVLATERLNLRLDLLVLRHGQVRNQMVFNLVIEPHLGKIYPVVSGLVVHRSQDLIHVKLLFVFVVVVEAEQVRTGVIGTDDHVGVEVRDELGQHSIDEHE